MNKNRINILLILTLLAFLMPLASYNGMYINGAYIVSAQPQKKVVFSWVNQTAKEFWVNNTYISCYFEGTQGGSLIDIRHHDFPDINLCDDVKMAATGPDIGWTSSRWGIDPSNVSVSYREIKENLLEVNVTTLNNNIKFEIIFYFTDSEIILVRYRATLLSDINITGIGAEYVPKTIAGKGSRVVTVDYFGNLITHTLNGSMLYIVFGNGSEGTLPLKENWMAVYDPTRNIFAGIVWLNPSMFIGDRSTVGVWDGAVWGVASLVSRWYDNPAGKVFPKGTIFENYVLIVVGKGDYNKIRSLGWFVRNIGNYYQSTIEKITREYNEYKKTHTHSDTEYNTLKSNYDSLQTKYNTLKSDYDKLESDYKSLQSEYNDYKSKYTVTPGALQQAQTTYTVIGLIIGLIIGFVVAWFIKKK